MRVCKDRSVEGQYPQLAILFDAGLLRSQWARPNYFILCNFPFYLHKIVEIRESLGISNCGRMSGILLDCIDPISNFLRLGFCIFNTVDFLLLFSLPSMSFVQQVNFSLLRLIQARFILESIRTECVLIYHRS